MGAVIRFAVCAAVLAATLAGPAAASAPPVGPLPPEPTILRVAKAGRTFRIAAPKPAAGRVWRIARAYDARIVREIREGETKTTIWWDFRAVRPGKTTIVLAQTRGERPHVYAARRIRVTVVA
jgi:predicted secreted protein